MRRPGQGEGRRVWGLPALQAGTEPVAPRRPLVRSSRAVEEGRGRGQASGASRGSARRRAGGAARTAAVRAAVGPRESQHRLRTAAAAAARADAGAGAPQGLHPRRRRAVGAADRAEAAANALLKALEEPPANTVFVLTASAPEALLPTILSRVVRVRVARLADSIVAAFAQQELGVTGQRAVAQRVAAAEGCIGRVLAEGERGDRGGE